MQGAEASIPYSWVPHIFPWVERGTAQVDILPQDVIPRETVCISGRLNPRPLDNESNTLPTEPHETLIACSNFSGYNFAFNDPTVWNDLPDDVHAAPTLASFRTKLESYLFKKAFPP